MIKSMTGFGRSEESSSSCDLKIEIKSVNSRYCDVNIRMPKIFNYLEMALKNMVQEKMLRGKIDVSIDARFAKPSHSPVLNRQNFIASMSVLEQMKKLGGLKDEITLSNILVFNDLVEYEAAENIEDLSTFIGIVLNAALNEVDRMREAEGKNLENQISRLLDNIEFLHKKVEESCRDVYNYWLERFKTRMQEFKVSENKDLLIQEAAIYAEKADIKEELSRVTSHLTQFRKIMRTEFPCGKKLDFLCQELYREWNTIASKSVKADIINVVVEAKSSVESIREQVQNII